MMDPAKYGKRLVTAKEVAYDFIAKSGGLFDNDDIPAFMAGFLAALVMKDKEARNREEL